MQVYYMHVVTRWCARVSLRRQPLTCACDKAESCVESSSAERKLVVVGHAVAGEVVVAGAAVSNSIRRGERREIVVDEEFFLHMLSNGH